MKKPIELGTAVEVDGSRGTVVAIMHDGEENVYLIRFISSRMHDQWLLPHEFDLEDEGEH